MIKIPDSYFKNRQEQYKIELALTSAIPEDVYYYNLIVVLSSMLNRSIKEMIRDDAKTSDIQDEYEDKEK